MSSNSREWLAHFLPVDVCQDGTLMRLYLQAFDRKTTAVSYAICLYFKI